MLKYYTLGAKFGIEAYLPIPSIHVGLFEKHAILRLNF